MILVRNIRKKNLYWHHIHNNQSQKAIPQNFHQKANKIWKFQSIYKDWNPIKFFIDKSPLNNSPGDLHRINKMVLFLCVWKLFFTTFNFCYLFCHRIGFSRDTEQFVGFCKYIFESYILSYVIRPSYSLYIRNVFYF